MASDKLSLSDEKEAAIEPELWSVDSLVVLTCHFISNNLDEFADKLAFLPSDVIERVIRLSYMQGGGPKGHVYGNSIITPSLLLRLQPAISQIHTLNLANCDQVSDVTLEVNCPHWASLTSLDLTRCRKITSIEPICEFVKDLRMLHLDMCNRLNHLGARKIHQLQELEELGMKGTRISSVTLEESISKLPKLVKLNICSSKYVSSGLKEVTGTCTLLTHLLIKNCLFDDDQVLHIQNLKQLEVLDLGFSNNVTDIGFSGIRPLRNMRCLDLSLNPRLTDEGIENISEMEALEVLKVTRTGISDEACEYISQLKNLRILHIDKNSITDQGARKLTELKDLHELFIGHSGITDLFVADGIPLLKKLRILKITGASNISNWAVEELSKTQMEVIDMGLDGSHLTGECCQYLDRFKNLRRINFWVTKIKPHEMTNFLMRNPKYIYDTLMRTTKGTYLVVLKDGETPGPSLPYHGR